jgi:hypothetical protein
MNALFVAVFVLLSLSGILIGLLLVKNPALAIELQKRFYRRINWKIEPISLSKEIRNTRLMGEFLAVVSVATIALAISNISSLHK